MQQLKADAICRMEFRLLGLVQLTMIFKPILESYGLIRIILVEPFIETAQQGITTSSCVGV
jgi:hypothetical protein